MLMEVNIANRNVNFSMKILASFNISIKLLLLEMLTPVTFTLDMLIPVKISVSNVSLLKNFDWKC